MTLPSLTGSGTLDVTTIDANIGTDNTTSAVFNGTIVGTGGNGINKVGTGTQTLTLASTATYNGPTTIIGGTLKLGIVNTLPSGFGTGDVTVTSPGILDMNGLSQSINSLNGSGTVDNKVAGLVTLTIGANGDAGAFSGAIQNTAGSVSLTKTGTGVQSLSGVNTYSGATNIAGGTIQLFNFGGLYTSALNAALPTLNTSSLWLDANNANANGTPSTGIVTTWKDLSPNGRNATVTTGSTGATAVANDAALGKLQALRFSGATTYDVNMSFLQNNSAYTIFAVESVSAVGNYYFLGTNAGAANQGLHFGYRSNTDFTMAQFGNDLDWTTVPAGTGTARQWTGEFAPAAVTNGPSAGHYIFYNGTNTANNGNTQGFVSLTGITGIVGAGYAYNNKYSGDLGEVIMFNTALDYATRQKIEAYLTAKWVNGYAAITPVSTILPPTTAVTVSNGGTLDLFGFTQTIGSLTSTDSMGSKVLLGSATLNVGNSTSTVFDGVISGSGNIVKQGAGALSLSGLNTFTGTTAVNAGKLQIAPLGATVSPTNVKNGAILEVDGTATAVNVMGSNASAPAAAGSQLRGIGVAGNATAVDATKGNAVIWPGLATGNSSLTANETLTVNSVDFSNGGKLAVVLRAAGGPFNQELLTTPTVPVIPISSIGESTSGNGTTVSIVTQTQQNLQIGQAFSVSGVQPPGFNGGPFIVTASDTNNNIIQYTAPVSGLGFGSGGQIGPATLPVTIPAGTTPGSAATLSFAVDSLNNNNQYVVLDTGSSDGITSSFGIVVGPPGSSYGASYDVIYRDLVNGLPDIVSPSLGTVLANPVSQVIIAAKNSNVTPVKIDAFSAQSEGAGVLVTWNSVSEFKNAGFNLYRRSGELGIWTRINPTLIAGRVTNPDVKKYGFFDWPSPGIFEYRLESISLSGEREDYAQLAGPVTQDNLETLALSIDVDGITAALDGVATEARADRVREAGALFAAANGQDPIAKGAATIAGLALDKNGNLLNAGRVINLDANPGKAFVQLETRAVTAIPHASDLAPSPISASARWFTGSGISTSNSRIAVKVMYDKPGVLAIPQSLMPAGFDIHHVAIQREGRSLNALAIANNTLYVYGQGYSDDYTNNDALFLRTIAGNTAVSGATNASGLFGSSQPVNVTSPASVETSYHEVYFDFGTTYRPYTYQPWFSSKYLTGGTDQSFTVTTPNATSGPATLVVTLWSVTSSQDVSPDHALQVLVNGKPAGQATWSGGNKMMQLSFDVPGGVLTSRDNTVDLITPAITGADDQTAFLYSLNVSYTETLDGSKPATIRNSSSGSQLFEIANLPSAKAWVVDTRFPDRSGLVPFETQVQGDGTNKLRFTAAAGGTGTYLVVSAGMENAPLSVARRNVAAIRSGSSFLAVGPIQFSAGVQPLLSLHSKEGLRSQFADQEAIFDYYGYGRYGPAPIQAAVRATRPQYLMLLGRTTYDYHNYSGENVDPLCPAFLVSTTFWDQTTSDSLFGDLGRGYPEVAVGRLPVNNSVELAVTVRHIVNYKGLSPSGPRIQATADVADPEAGDFAAQADSLIAAHSDLGWQRNYLGVTAQASADVTENMLAAANGGADILVYVGHGNAVSLGAAIPHILDVTSVQQWTGNVIFLQGTCNGHWMAKDVADYHSIVIQALTQPQGGISAGIGTSTYMRSESAIPFLDQLLKNTATPGMRWGNVLLKAQQWAFKQPGSYSADLGRTEQLFGDPAMSVYAPVKAGSIQAPATAPVSGSGTTTAGSGSMGKSSTNGAGAPSSAPSNGGGSTGTNSTNGTVLPGQF